MVFRLGIPDLRNSDIEMVKSIEWNLSIILLKILYCVVIGLLLWLFTGSIRLVCLFVCQYECLSSSGVADDLLGLVKYSSKEALLAIPLHTSYYTVTFFFCADGHLWRRA